MRAVVLLACVLLGCGSSSDQKPVERTRGIAPTQIAQEPPTAATGPAPESPTATTPAAWEDQPAKKGAEADKVVVQPEKKQDYSAELLSAIGSPLECLKPRQGPDVPASIDVELEAYFLQTGTMSRGYASSPQLDAEELRCIRAKLESIALNGPIEAAPLTVNARLSFKLKLPVNPAN